MVLNGYMNISTLQMHYFLAVVECESFTNAANQLFTTQSSLSKAISSIEKTLDVQLFIRNKKRLQVTEAGWHLYEKWRMALNDIEKSVIECRAKRGGKVNSLLISGLDTHKIDEVVLPTIREYRLLYPSDQIYLETNSIKELRRGLINGDFDVVITTLYDIEQLGAEGFDHTIIASSPHHICMMKDHPLAGKDSIDIPDLKNYPFVSISPNYTPSYNGMLSDLCMGVGSDLAEGRFGEVLWAPSRSWASSLTGETHASLAEVYADETGREITAPMIAKYYGVEIAVDAITRAASFDNAALRDAIAETDLDTIFGHVKFEDDHGWRSSL